MFVVAGLLLLSWAYNMEGRSDRFWFGIAVGSCLIALGLYLINCTIRTQFFRCTYIIDSEGLTKRFPSGKIERHNWADLESVSLMGVLKFRTGAKISGAFPINDFLRECRKYSNKDFVQLPIDGLASDYLWRPPEPTEKLRMGRRILWYFYTTPKTSFRRFVFYVFLGGSRLNNIPTFTTYGSILIGLSLAFSLEYLLIGTKGTVALLLLIPAGMILSFFLLWLFFLSRVLLIYPFPECRQGRCRGINDFEWGIGTVYGWEYLHWHFYECSCGDLYVRRGRRFMSAVEEGPRPYKKLVGFRRWANDPGPLPKWADLGEDTKEE
ncbi:MAG: hypothetical protein WD873_03350 [Candidatus Hydrogenedentales bacterium]